MAEEMIDTARAQDAEPTGWAEVADSTFHGYWDGDVYDTRFLPWDLVWLQTPVPPSGARFASVFRLGDCVYDYFLANRVKEGTGPHLGKLRPSITGFKDATPGMIGVDLDRKDLSDALCDARRILQRLREHGVREDAYRCFFSGSKGFSIHLLAEAFGAPLDRITATNLPQHERQVLLCLRAVCGGVTFDPASRQTIRLFRLPNSPHQKSGLFKIPLSPKELDNLSVADIKALAKAPRTDLPIIPNGAPDNGLMGLLEEVIEAEAENTAALEAIQFPLSTRVPSGDAFPLVHAHSFPAAPSPLSESLAEVILSRIQPLITDGSFAWSHGVHAHWHSLPISGRDDSASGHDFHLARELCLLDWPMEHVEAAIQLRPGSAAKKKSGDAVAIYIRRTALKAKEYAERAEALKFSRSPTAKARGPLGPETSDLTGTWLYNSRLWRPRSGLGKWARDIYLFHLQTAKNMSNFAFMEGTWSDNYFLSLRTVSAQDIALASEKTVRRHSEFLKALGLLKLVREGRRSEASTYRVYVPTRTEEDRLVRGAEVAKEFMQGKAMKRDRLREMKKRAKEAMNQEDIGTGESYLTLDTQDEESVDVA